MCRHTRSSADRKREEKTKLQERGWRQKEKGTQARGRFQESVQSCLVDRAYGIQGDIGHMDPKRTRDYQHLMRTFWYGCIQGLVHFKQKRRKHSVHVGPNPRIDRGGQFDVATKRGQLPRTLQQVLEEGGIRETCRYPCLQGQYGTEMALLQNGRHH